ncbi:MAG: glycosyltransferase family 2 protein [Acidimicrobiaceae bacterium]|nr:glycosyltransferase family 2 protein [Acidimicrobiaceae bacterium]
MLHTKFERLSVFFPMWNEEQYLQRALKAAHDLCQELIGLGTIADYQIVIVDDASTDSTPQMADEAARRDTRVKVVHHPINRKLGGSIKSGFAASTGDIVLYTDADLPFDMREVHNALRLMRQYEADIVSAYRFDRTGEGYVRVVYSMFYNFLVRVLFGVRFRDINFAFKLCRKTVFDRIELESEGSFIDAELIVSAKKLNMSVVQFGVDYFPRTRGVSTLSSPSVIIKILREAFHLRKKLNAITPDSAI